MMISGLITTIDEKIDMDIQMDKDNRRIVFVVHHS